MNAPPLLLSGLATLTDAAAKADIDPLALLTEGLGLAPLENAWQNAGLAGALEDALDELAAAGEAATAVIAAWETEDRFLIAAAAAELLAALVTLSQSLEALPATLQGAINDFSAGSEPLLAEYAANPTKLASRAFGWLGLVGISHTLPFLITPLTAVGLIEWRRRDPDVAGSGELPPFMGILRLDRLPTLLSQPLAVLEEAHGWGTDALDLEPLLRLLHEPGSGKRIPLPEVDGRVAARHRFGLIREDFVLRPPGLLIEVSRDIAADVSGNVPVAYGWSMEGFAALSAEGEVALRVKPPGGLEIEAAAASEGSARFGIAMLPDEDRPFLELPFAALSASRLTAGIGAVLTGKVASTGRAVLEGGPKFDLGIEGLRLCITSATADSFLKSIMGSARPAGAIDLRAHWSPDQGLSFEGSGQLTVRQDQSIDIGPISIRAMELALGLSTEGIALDAGIDLAAKLGPLAVVVERVGARFALVSKETGSLGFDSAFLPPRGLGLAIDAGPVTGGGYLFFDLDNAEYAGVLDLDIGEIGVTAVGLLTTQLPDGEDGFSLVLIITAEFPPIQLGFGFTLDGLGGLVGINRGTDVDVLRDGVRTGTIGSIMFPEDPVANAPRIVSDIGRAFPPARGQYTFGPMAMLGWGTPSLLRAELGVLLELDSPLRVVILGQLLAGLPSLDVKPRLVDIRMDVLGIIDFDRQELTIDAALVDSRIVHYALSGEMAMRLRWGDSPFFAISIGGLHPAYPRPPELPQLQRLAISLGKGNNPRFRLECYLAVTSNTVQVGALLDLYAAAAGFSLAGHLGFDALFEFSPFAFQIDMRAKVAIKAGSRTVMALSLRFILSGPSPWQASGKAVFEIFFVDIEIPFSATFGSAEQPELPLGDPRGALLEALGQVDNWQVELPETLRVRLRQSDTSVRKLVHPAGTLGVRQTVVPLGLELERFGNTKVGNDKLFRVDSVTTGEGANAQTLSPGPVLKEYFAPASYLELTEAEKLAFPSFEKMGAGVSALGSKALLGAPSAGQAQKDLDTHTILFDRQADGASRDAELAARSLDADTLAKSAALGAAAKARAARGRHGRFAARSRNIGLSDEAWLIVTSDTLDTVPAGGLPGRGVAPIPELEDPEASSHAGAVVALRAHLRRHPADKDRLQIVAQHEAMAA